MIKNIQTIYYKFEEKQAKLRKEYLASGMTEESIQEMYDFDKSQLARDIAYKRRREILDVDTESLSSLGKNPILKDYIEEFSVEMDFSLADRYFWIEEISDEILAKKLKCLSKDDLELITLIVCNEKTQIETSEILGIPYRTLKYKIKKIKKFLK